MAPIIRFKYLCHHLRKKKTLHTKAYLRRKQRSHEEHTLSAASDFPCYKIVAVIVLILVVAEDISNGITFIQIVMKISHFKIY